MRTFQLASIAGGSALVALLAACGTTSTPVASTAPPASVQAAPERVEYGQVTNIESIGGTGTAARSGPSVPGAILGAVAGGVVGNQVGSGTGRTAATVLGAAGGAAVGSQVGRSNAPLPQPMYRVTVQTQSGVMRYYDVPATNDLRVGDRVQVEHGVIYRS